MLGETLNDRYILSGLLGSGEMAEVFLARDHTLVAGNVLVEQGVQNALYTLELLEERAPVFPCACEGVSRTPGTQ